MADEVERLFVTLEANADKLVRDTTQAIKDLEKELQQMGDQGEQALDKTGKSASKLGGIFDRIKNGISGFVGRFKATGDAGKKAFDDSGRAAQKFGGILGSLKDVAIAFVGVLAFDKLVGFFQNLAGSIISVGTAAVQSNAQFETFKTQFETLLGSAEAAQQRLDELARFGQQTPFELNEVTSASRVLEVFGGATLATGDNLKMIGDIAAGVNQPFQDVAFWVGRMYDAVQSGKPFGEAAARLQEMGALSGQTRTRLEDMQKAGVEGAEIFAVFSEEVGGKFAGNMERLSATFQGVMSNLVDFRDALIRIGGEPLFEEIRDSAKEFLDIISEEEMNAAILAVAKSAGEAAANLTKIVSSGIVESFEGLEPETLQKFADALDDFGAALSQAFGGEVKADLNLVVDSLTMLIDIGTAVTNVFNRFNTVAKENQGVIQGVKEAFLALASPIFQIIEDFKLLNAVIEAGTGKRLVDFSRILADSSETAEQAAAKYSKAAEEIANLSAMGPGTQAAPEEPVVPVIEIDEEQQKLLDKLDDYAEDFIDATEERNQAVEELEAEHVEKVAEIEQEAIDDRIEVWEDLNKDLVKLEEESTQKRIEAAEKYQDALEDLEEDTATKRSDIIRKAKEDLAKVEKSTDDKLEDERQEFNQEEKRDTEDHLNELRQIRERYLMSLEDAVKSRDARAIVDLRRRFEQETAETESSFETEQSRRREDKDQRLAEIRQEEQERSAEILRNREQELMQLGEQEARKRQQLEESYNQQITKINEQEARKRAELMARAQEEIATINESEAEKLAAETERFDERQAALEEMLAKRLETVAKALADEEEMNSESAQKVLEALNETFGAGGDIDKLMEDFTKRRHKKLTVRLDFEGVQATREEQKKRPPSGGNGRGRPFQHGTGGPQLFTKPTAAIFAETSPEVVNITPLSQLGKMGGDMGSREMDLSVRLSGSAPPGINNGADRDALAGVLVSALREAGFRAKNG